MINPTECGSRNDIHRVTLDTQGSTPKTDFAVSKIVNICNLPVELKQEIAFNLDSKDYANLRATGKIMSESLDSFSVINNKLTQGHLSGHAEKKAREIMRDYLIRNLLGGNQTNEITLSLKNCFSRPDKTFEDVTAVGTEYLPDKYGQPDDRIADMIKCCTRGMASATHMLTSSFRTFKPDAYPGQLWFALINLSDPKINTESLNSIFSTFNKFYHDTEGNEKFVVATLASTLRNYWADKPPSMVNKEDMTNLSVAYPELFSVGDNVVKVVHESSVKPLATTDQRQELQPQQISKIKQFIKRFLPGTD